MVFHNVSNYNYHFIKELAKEYEWQFSSNSQRSSNFWWKWRKNSKILYKLQFIDTVRFMASSLSNLVNNLAEGIHKIKFKYGHHDKKCETRIKSKYCKCCLKYTSIIDDLVEYNCLCCKKKYQRKFDEDLRKRFVNTYKFSNHDINRFILL